MTEIYNNLIKILDELREQEISEEEEAFPSVDDQDVPITRNKYKVIVVGDPAVGKTSTVLQFTDRAFRQTYSVCRGKHGYAVYRNGGIKALFN